MKANRPPAPLGLAMSCVSILLNACAPSSAYIRPGIQHEEEKVIRHWIERQKTIWKSQQDAAFTVWSRDAPAT